MTQYLPKSSIAATHTSDGADGVVGYHGGWAVRLRPHAEIGSALQTSRASSGELVQRAVPLTSECQELMENSLGLDWWPPKTHVQSSDLCRDCREIDFKAIFPHSGVFRKWSRIHCRITESYQQTIKDTRGIDSSVNDSNCKLCRHLAAARRRMPGEPEAGTFLEIVFHNHPEHWLTDEDAPGTQSRLYMNLCHPPLNQYTSDQDQDICPQRGSNTIICHINKPIRVAYCPQIVSPAFNVSLAKSWIVACDQKHPECTIDHKLQMPNTRLIDCATRRLISAGDDAIQRPLRFVALSYVWGPTQHRTILKEDGSLPSKLPLTLQDAMTVTEALGFQYIWIDQYCIDQADEEGKDMQVRHMDLIYKHADITIIAAAGDDCNYGLPGVSDRPRDLPDPFILDEVPTFGTSPQGNGHWKSGSWHTRGWTFQEAYLSRRRLVFSDTAMHFECMRYGERQKEMSGGVECAQYDGESTQWTHEGEWSEVHPVVSNFELPRPPEVHKHLLQPPLPSLLESFLQPLLQPVPVRHTSLEASMLLYTGLVSQYTRRKLSFPSDGLNAFRGAANALAQFDPAVYSIAGIPFVMHDYVEDSLTEITFSHGLAWRSSAGGIVSESNFPSWSWGNVSVWNVHWSPDGVANRSHATHAIDYPRSVRIEFDTNGKSVLIGLAEFAQACRNSTPISRRNPTAVCFQARILSSRVSSRIVPDMERAGHHWKVPHIGRAGFTWVGFGSGDIGYGSGGHETFSVRLSVDRNDAPRDDNRATRQVDNAQASCLVEMYSEGLYGKFVSGRCDFMLLRCNNEWTQALVIEWQDKPQETARRIGIVEFWTARQGCQNSTDLFLSCFSIERELRLI